MIETIINVVGIAKELFDVFKPLTFEPQQDDTSKSSGSQAVGTSKATIYTIESSRSQSVDTSTKDTDTDILKKKEKERRRKMKYCAANFKRILVLFPLRTICFICEVTFGAITFHNNRMDLQSYQENPRISMQIGNQTVYATVNVTQFKTAHYVYLGFYIVSILSSLCHLKFHASKKPQTPFRWVAISIVFVMPIMVCESFMLKSRGIIDWNEQFWDLVSMLVFIFILPVQCIIDVWSLKKSSCCRFFLSICLSLLSFLLGCLLYSIPFLTLASLKHSSLTRMTAVWIFQPVAGRTKNALALLAVVGIIGIWILRVLIVLTFLAIVTCCFCKCWCCGKCFDWDMERQKKKWSKRRDRTLKMEAEEKCKRQSKSIM